MQRLQLRLSGKHNLITDEMSMFGKRTLAWVDKRLRQATGELHKPLGGISVMLLGDSAQLPAVGDKPTYASPSQSSSLLAQHGHSIYSLFETIVMLSENIRQAGNNPEAEQFRAVLLGLRYGQTIHDDWMTVCQRTPQYVNMSNVIDAPRLYFDKLSVAKYDFEKLKNLGSPITRISPLHLGRNAKNATLDDPGGLDAVMFLARGAVIMLTGNPWQDVGLCNGVTGVVEDLLSSWSPSTLQTHCSTWTVRKLHRPAFLATNPKTVPIPPHLFEWESDEQRLSRQQLPLRG